MEQPGQESAQGDQLNIKATPNVTQIEAPPTGGYTTPQSRPPEGPDLTKTYTRRAAVPKDISPVPDVASLAEGVSSRASARATRQKTMTMDSCGTVELRRLFADARQSGITLDDLETRMVDLLRTKEAEMNGRLGKAMEQVELLETRDRNNEANLMVYRALVSEYQMMLEELTCGAYIHVGRLEEYGYNRNGVCGGSCKVSAERDALKAELDTMHDDYSKIYEMYKKVRKVAEDQKSEYDRLEHKYLEKVEDIKSLHGKMSRLREDAQKKLKQASQDMEECLREKEESLVGLKLKVRQLEVDLKSSQRELELKKNEAAELRDICNQLLSQMEPPGSDVEQ